MPSNGFQRKRSLSFGARDHAVAAERRGLLDRQASGYGLSPFPSRCGSPQSPQALDDFLPGSALWRAPQQVRTIDESLKSSTPVENSPRSLPRKPSWPRAERKGAKVRRSLSRRHSISFEAQPATELSKLKGFLTQTSLDGKPGFEFVCSEQFREKYESYMGLDKEPDKRRPTFLNRLHSSLFRRSASNDSNISTTVGGGDGRGVSGQKTAAPPAAVDQRRQSLKLVDDGSMRGVCQACRYISGSLVPHSTHHAQLVDASKQLNLHQEAGGDTNASSSRERVAMRKGRHHTTGSLLKSTTGHGTMSPGAGRKWRQWWKAATGARSDGRAPQSDAAARRLGFVFDAACASERLWISKQGHCALSLGQAGNGSSNSNSGGGGGSARQLVAQPGFKQGTHAWRIAVLSSANVPSALRAASGVGGNKERDGNVGSGPRSKAKKGWRRRSYSSGSDYAIPIDAVGGRRSSGVRSSALGGGEKIPCAAAGSDDDDEVDERSEGGSGACFHLSVGLCLRSCASSHRPAPAPRPVLEETAALNVSVRKRGTVAAAATTTAEQQSPTASLNRSSSLLDRIVSSHHGQRHRHSCQSLQCDDVEGGAGELWRWQTTMTSSAAASAERMREGMAWRSGDTGTVTVECSERYLSVVNHRTGEAHDLALGTMVAYDNVVDTESSEESDGYDDDDDDGDVVAALPLTSCSGLSASQTACRSQHCVRTKWLHPYFVLHDPAMVLLIMDGV